MITLPATTIETTQLRTGAYTPTHAVLEYIQRRDLELAELLQLVREALQAFEELRVSDIRTKPGHVIDLRDWEKAATAAIAKAEGR